MRCTTAPDFYRNVPCGEETSDDPARFDDLLKSCATPCFAQLKPTIDRFAAHKYPQL
ncbi:hypothetical protein [Hominenteromicrobium sp.]|uniref:hypothetical protein n=1 Tax=Hominenteromicrobium sp. TaxID=3073581 RepID=UPI00399AA2DD